MDAERSRLAQERQGALAELAHLRQGTCDVGGEACEQQRAQQGGAAEQAQQAQQLQRELAVERRRRRQAELDFQELLSSMDLLQPSASPSPCDSTGASAPGRAAQQQQGQQQQEDEGEAGRGSQLQAVVAQLQRENAALRADLHSNRRRFCTAAAAGSSLQSIAQVLHSMGAGSAG